MDDGRSDEWMLKDRRGRGGMKEVLNGLGSEHQGAHDQL